MAKNKLYRVKQRWDTQIPFAEYVKRNNWIVICSSRAMCLRVTSVDVAFFFIADHSKFWNVILSAGSK